MLFICENLILIRVDQISCRLITLSPVCMEKYIGVPSSSIISHKIGTKSHYLDTAVFIGKCYI